MSRITAKKGHSILYDKSGKEYHSTEKDNMKKAIGHLSFQAKQPNSTNAKKRIQKMVEYIILCMS